jgi:hypothetical protein
VAREVLELDDDAGEDLVRGNDEFLDQLVIGRAANARLVQADVQRIVEELGVVGADVEQHGQALRGMHAGARRVERQLADGNAHAVRAEIAEAEDPLAVAHHDDRDLAARPVREHAADASAIGGADEDSPRALEDVRVALAGEADRRRVDDRRHLVRMLDQQPVEERLVAVVQRAEVDVLLEIARLAAEILEHARELLLLGGDVRRKKAAQLQPIALLFRERGAFVEEGILQQWMPSA